MVWAHGVCLKPYYPAKETQARLLVTLLKEMGVGMRGIGGQFGGRAITTFAIDWPEHWLRKEMGKRSMEMQMKLLLQ